jgi:glycerophosphoryl diester phosphodiesterase
VSHDFRLYAHRGCPAELPENTLPAFQRAVELGVDALEMDVHLTRDGHPIVSHDANARRMTGQPRAWNQLDLSAAQQLDVGYGFVAADGTRPFVGRGFQAPSLEAVLTTFTAIRINVDIKQWQPAMVSPLLALIRRCKAEERVTLASFRVRTLLSVRRRGYGGETALGQREVAALWALPARVFEVLPFVGTAAQVPLRVGPIRLDRPEFIERCHRLGMRVDYWTVDDPATDRARRRRHHDRRSSRHDQRPRPRRAVIGVSADRRRRWDAVRWMLVAAMIATGCSGPVRAYPRWRFLAGNAGAPFYLPETAWVRHDADFAVHVTAGCVDVEVSIRMSGKTGVGVTSMLRSTHTCAVAISRAELVLGERHIPAELPPPQNLPGRSLQYVWLPFAFDNNAAWNDGPRLGHFEFDLVVDGAAPVTLAIPAMHRFDAGRFMPRRDRWGR